VKPTEYRPTITAKWTESSQRLSLKPLLEILVTVYGWDALSISKNGTLKGLRINKLTDLVRSSCNDTVSSSHVTASNDWMTVKNNLERM
jgi:hypothetical protein